jgi:hypothetical protein
MDSPHTPHVLWLSMDSRLRGGPAIRNDTYQLFEIPIIRQVIDPGRFNPSPGYSTLIDSPTELIWMNNLASAPQATLFLERTYSLLFTALRPALKRAPLEAQA